MRFNHAVAVGVLLTLLGGATTKPAQAQQMLLVAPSVSGKINTPITFDIFTKGNTGLAVAWGTSIALSDPVHMTFAPDVDGQGHPYRDVEAFFDGDLSDTSQTGNGVLNLAFYNTTPGANFGFNGMAFLAEFQILLDAGTPLNTDLTIGLAPLGIPPSGTAMLDDVGNNILQPTDPTRPNDNVSLAHLFVTGSGPNLRWFLGSPPQEVPEPSVWLTGVAGLSVGVCLLRRRRIRTS